MFRRLSPIPPVKSRRVEPSQDKWPIRQRKQEVLFAAAVIAVACPSFHQSPPGTIEEQFAIDVAVQIREFVEDFDGRKGTKKQAQGFPFLRIPLARPSDGISEKVEIPQRYQFVAVGFGPAESFDDWPKASDVVVPEGYPGNRGKIWQHLEQDFFQMVFGEGAILNFDGY